MDSNLACSNKIHRLDDGTISLDMALVMLSRLQEPFRDADVAAYDGYEACDASGLNAAITVLRQTYRAVLLLLQESVDGYLHDKVGKATAEIFLTLKKNEEAFPLLDCAWRNIPLLDFTAGPEMKEGVKKEHKDILDKFFGAWNGLKGDLCFSAILAGNEAAKYVWDLARFHFYSPFKWTKHSSGLWVLMKPTGPTELLSKLSLIEWFAHDKSTLPEHLQGLFAPRQVPLGTASSVHPWRDRRVRAQRSSDGRPSRRRRRRNGADKRRWPDAVQDGGTRPLVFRLQAVCGGPPAEQARRARLCPRFRPANPRKDRTPPTRDRSVAQLEGRRCRA
jgi:hypothetical protein